jgi:hypothetical protein
MSLRSRFPRADRFPPSQSTPQSEMEAVRRTEHAPDRSEQASPAPGSVWPPLVAVALVIIAGLVIAGWFLIGPPSAHGLAG